MKQVLVLNKVDFLAMQITPKDILRGRKNGIVIPGSVDFEQDRELLLCSSDYGLCFETKVKKSGVSLFANLHHIPDLIESMGYTKDIPIKDLFDIYESHHKNVSAYNVFTWIMWDSDSIVGAHSGNIDMSDVPHIYSVAQSLLASSGITHGGKS